MGREAVMSENAGVTQRLSYEWEGDPGTGREPGRSGKEGTVFGKGVSYECLGTSPNDVDISRGNTDFYCFLLI